MRFGETITDTVTLTVSDLTQLFAVRLGSGGFDAPPPPPQTIPLTTEFSFDIIIEGVNEAPVAQDDTATVNEDGTVEIDVLANDNDPDGDPLFLISATAENGVVEVPADPPSTGEGGENDVLIENSVEVAGSANDGDQEDAPLVPPSNPGDEEGSDDPGAPSNSDEQEDNMRGVGAKNGIVTVSPGGVLIYTPNPDFVGEDTITYTIFDGTEIDGGTSTAEVTVTVNPVNDDPVAQADRATTDEDTPVNIDVLANDSDRDEDDLTVTSASANNGDVVIEDDGTLTYTPNPNFNGRDQITYTIEDGNGGSAQAFVGVRINPVNDRPDARDDGIFTVAEDGYIIVDVLANDTDVDGDPLTIVGFPLQAGGQAELTNDGQVRFTPTPDFNGGAFFTYSVSDGNGGTRTGAAIFDVTPINDAPTTSPGRVVADEDDGVFSIRLADFVTEVDEDILNFSLIAADRAGDPIPFSIQDDAVLGDNGLIVIDPEVLGLNEGESANTVFTYTVTDDSGDTGNDTATGTVSLTINGADDSAPDPTPNQKPVAADFSTSANEADGPVVIDLSKLISDPDVDDVLTITSLNVSPTETDATPDVPIAFSIEEGALRIDTDFLGGFVPAGESRTIDLIYTVSDGSLTDTGTISLTLSEDPTDVPDPSNTPPVARDVPGTSGFPSGTDDFSNVVPGDVIVDDPDTPNFVINMSGLISDAETADDELIVTFGDFFLGETSGEGDGGAQTVPFNYDPNTLVLTVKFADIGLADGEEILGSVNYTVSDGTASDTGQIAVNFVNPLDDDTGPGVIRTVLDFEEFESRDGPSLPIEGSKGFTFGASATVVETDEIASDGGRGGSGVSNGQTTRDGANVLVGTATTATTREPVIDPKTDQPIIGEDGSPLFIETTEVVESFAIYGPNTPIEIGGAGVSLGTGIMGSPPAVTDQLLEFAGFGDPFDLNSLSLNPTIGNEVDVTLTTYVAGIVQEPSNGASSDFLRLVEGDSFVFTVDASTPATALDFNGEFLTDDVPNNKPEAFDDLYAVEFTTTDGTALVLDDIAFTIGEEFDLA